MDANKQDRCMTGPRSTIWDEMNKCAIDISGYENITEDQLGIIDLKHDGEDDSPLFADGCDSEGFVGGCVRFGHTPETCPNKADPDPRPSGPVSFARTFGKHSRSKSLTRRLDVQEKDYWAAGPMTYRYPVHPYKAGRNFGTGIVPGHMERIVEVRGPEPQEKDVKTIVLDLDGVLVDFVGPSCAAHGIDPDKLQWIEGKYDIAHVCGISNPKFWDKLGHDFWANLPWMKDGHEILKSCCRAVGGEHNIVICTTPTACPYSASGKMEWIYKNLPSFRKRFLIGPPKHFLANPNTILVDDADHNYGAFVARQGEAVLVPRIWNGNYKLRDQTLAYVDEQLRRLTL